MSTRAIGRYGEQLTVSYLRKHNYKILYTNWTTYAGELDIIALRRFLVFVEVKYVASDKNFFPNEQYTQSKSHKLLRTINAFFFKHPEFQEYFDNWRLDLICLTGPRDCCRLVHYRNVLGR